MRRPPIGGDFLIEDFVTKMDDLLLTTDFDYLSRPVAAWTGGEWTWSWNVDETLEAEDLPEREITLVVRPFFYPSGAQEASLETVRVELVANIWTTDRPEGGTVLSLFSATFPQAQLEGKVDDIGGLVAQAIPPAVERVRQIAAKFLDAEPHTYDPIGAFNEALEALRTLKA